MKTKTYNDKIMDKNAYAQMKNLKKSKKHGKKKKQ